jgi:hypothetical protein
MSFDPRDPPDPYDDRNQGYREGARRPADPQAPRDPYDYRDPLDPTAVAGEGQRQAARGQIMGPAIMLIVVGVLNLVSGVFMVFIGIAMHSVPSDQLEAQMKQQNPEQVKEMQKAGISVKDMQNWEGWGFLISGIVSLLCGLIILAGGGCMLGFKLYVLGILAAILALISPGGCCVFGLIGGIWGLIALINPDVRAAYR